MGLVAVVPSHVLLWMLHDHDGERDAMPSLSHVIVDRTSWHEKRQYSLGRDAPSVVAVMLTDRFFIAGGGCFELHSCSTVLLRDWLIEASDYARA